MLDALLLVLQHFANTATLNGHENLPSWYLNCALRVCIHCSLFLIQLRGKMKIWTFRYSRA